MKLVIEASNIRKGGGVTHLQEVLNAADFTKYGFSKIVLWAPQSTIDRVGVINGLESKTHPLIEKGGWSAYRFRKFVLDQLIGSDTDLLWAPGGTCISSFRPYVTMVQNFLPFEKEERDRYKYSKAWWRYMYLEHVQAKSFKQARGLIHISHKTDEVINGKINLSGVEQVTIHHGLNERFHLAPRPQRECEEFTEEKPARILYVSPINYYKHQDKLIQACAMVRANGLPLQLDLVGPAFPPAKVAFDRIMAVCDPGGDWVHWHNEVPYNEVQNYYRNADLYACMSSCETFGMILLEAMASGLPVLCSNKSALPEIQGGTCPEVDPENVSAVARNLEEIIRSRSLREKCASAAYERAKSFTWAKCADQTFAFLACCATPRLNK